MKGLLADQVFTTRSILPACFTTQALPAACLHTLQGRKFRLQAPNPHQVKQHKTWRTAARRKDSPILAPVISTTPSGEDYTDLYSYLFRNRIIYIRSRINDEVATQIVSALLALNIYDKDADIKMYINSAGGSPYAIFSILDTMAEISNDISTVALGQSCSHATLLLAAGTKGKRFAMPSTRIMLHQPSGGGMGSADQVNITITELNRTMQVIHKFYQQFTGLPLEKVEEETDRDNFLNPEQAKELGLIDAVL